MSLGRDESGACSPAAWARGCARTQPCCQSRSFPVGDRPILELIFDWLARSDVTRADVCIGHLGELIQTYFSQAQTIPAGLDVHWQLGVTSRWAPRARCDLSRP